MMAARQPQQDAPAPSTGSSEVLSGVPEGLVPLLLGNLIQQAAQSGGGAVPLFVHIARDDRRLEAVAEGLAFFAPKVRVIQFPGLGYGALRPHRPQQRDRGRRIAALARLAATTRKDPTVVVTTVNAVLQRTPPREFIRRSLKTIAPGPAARHGRADPSSQPGRLHPQRHGDGARRVRRARRHPRPLPAGPRGPGPPRLFRRHAGADEGLRPGNPAHRQARAAPHPDADHRGGLGRGQREGVPPPLRRAVRPVIGVRPAL